MRAEYLLFNLLVGLPPLVLSFWKRSSFADQLLRAAIACLLGSIPFVIWDVVVSGRHWWFDPRYTLGVHVLGLPFEELLFFVTVPFACLYTWERVLLGSQSRAHASLRWTTPASCLLLAPAALVGWAGLEYTALALAAWALVAATDHVLGTALLATPRYWAFIAIVGLLTLVFNGYLTARPIVHYDPAYQLDLRLLTIPVEDFLFGFALVTSVVTVYAWGLKRKPLRSWIAGVIERHMGGYRQALIEVDERRPRRAEDPREVLVIGGGLAGIGAAAELGERGFRVTLMESKAVIGGKIAGWHERLEDGFEARVEHGFHAFFRHYYNLRSFLDRVGASAALRPIEDYVIVARDGRRFSFGTIETTPALNLISLARNGLYRLREVALGPAGRQLEAFLRYHPQDTLRRWDDVSFETFAGRARLPDDLKLVFTTFSRAFFADASRISMAELIKSFHFYYLSHDHGLTYDYVAGDFERGIVAPIERHLRSLGVEIRVGRPVETIERIGEGFCVAGAHYDAVVLATDVGAARSIVHQSPWIEREDPILAHQLGRMRVGQRYAVLRLWLDAPAPDELPVFVTIERRVLLDAVAFLHRVDPDADSWAAQHRGSVLELHCYAIPDEVSSDDVRTILLEELFASLPNLAAARVVHQHLQIRSDFTAYHVGLGHDRPATQTTISGLVLAGDWVRLPCPAMLMEAAYTSGVLAANALLEREGLCPAPLDTVPMVGVLVSQSRARGQAGASVLAPPAHASHLEGTTGVESGRPHRRWAGRR